MAGRLLPLIEVEQAALQLWQLMLQLGAMSAFAGPRGEGCCRDRYPHG